MHIPMEYKKKQYFGNFVSIFQPFLCLNRKFCQQKQGFLQVFGLGKEFD
jgi:hypothetical protein